MAKQRSTRPDLPQPAFQYDFFISYVTEDKEAVQQLNRELASRSGHGGHPELTCFLAAENWESGNDDRLVIREYLQKSQFVIVWVSPAYMKNQRGWVWFELCYAEALEEGLNTRAREIRLPFIAPIFWGVTTKKVERTPLLHYWQRGIGLFRWGRESDVAGAAQALIKFHAQELRKRAASPAPLVRD